MSTVVPVSLKYTATYARMYFTKALILCKLMLKSCACTMCIFKGVSCEL